MKKEAPQGSTPCLSSKTKNVARWFCLQAEVSRVFQMLSQQPSPHACLVSLVSRLFPPSLLFPRVPRVRVRVRACSRSILYVYSLTSSTLTLSLLPFSLIKEINKEKFSPLYSPLSLPRSLRSLGISTIAHYVRLV